MESTPDGEFIYGIPAFGSFDTGGGLKIARHGRGEIISPDTRDRTPDPDYIAHIDAYVQARIPELGNATHAEVCLYTETPDEDFIIDRHPACLRCVDCEQVFRDTVLSFAPSSDAS